MSDIIDPQPTDLAAVWGTALTAIHCANCGEAHLVPETDVPQRCPWCLQGPVEAQPAYLRDEPPEQVVPYRVPPQRLATMLDQWGEGIWFRPGDLTGSTLAKRARRYWVPLWLVDGQVEAVWKADVGFDYQVVSYQDRYRQGAGWHSQEVKEKRMRWEPRVGRLERTYENVAAPALDDHRPLMERMGQYDLAEREAYTPQAVGNTAVRIPSMEPEAAWPSAESAFERTQAEECREAAGADHIRNFTVQAEYKSLNWTQLLLPAYVTWYREGERIWPVLINGQSGHVSGVRRASSRKAITASLIVGAIALMLFVLGGLLALLGMAVPPISLAGGASLIIGVVLALVAPIPAISAWVANRRSSTE